MAGMEELANHIIAVAHNSNLPVTNLQVQKVMFFSLGMHIRMNNRIDELARETYDIPFEKWQYGPVVESVYYNLNHYKNKEITENGSYSRDYEEWDEIIERLLSVNVFDLVDISHRFPSWANFKDDILNRNFVEPYTLNEIAEDFLNE
ncbi:Panacea domain-containing protein [Heyndrickxia ginsengihumi]|nr:type II toxin-antitoxin system antitoxin SocA domain-containing protein [Heyndrickxia ginsengihumi]